jgi:hypothetical protein
MNIEALSDCVTIRQAQRKRYNLNAIALTIMDVIHRLLFKTQCFGDRTQMDNVQNCDSHKPMDSINSLGSYRRRNVFPVRYGQTYRVELSFK